VRQIIKTSGLKTRAGAASRVAGASCASAGRGAGRDPDGSPLDRRVRRRLATAKCVLVQCMHALVAGHACWCSACMPLLHASDLPLHLPL
jgi:hypothetical protein